MIEMQHMAAHVITSRIAWTTTHNKHRQASVCFVACWGGHNWGGYFLWWHFFGQGQEQRGICHSRWHNVWSLDLPGFAYKPWGMCRMLSKTVQIHSERPNKTWSVTPRSLDVYLRAIAHAADPLWDSKVGVAFGMVNLDTHGPTKNQNDCFNFL